ncbi:hypothetical protein KKA47_02925 [bacterium]|nr:hypothetical protein [bacterium]
MNNSKFKGILDFREDSKSVFTSGHTNEEVVDYFLTSKTREEVKLGFVTFAKEYFQNIALFIIWSRSIRLVEATGPNVIFDKGRKEEVRLADTNLFRSVIQSGHQYRGSVPLDKEGRKEFDRFLTEIPKEFWLYPVRVSDKVDFVVYADTCLGVEEHCTAKFEYILEKSRLAMRLMLVKKKLETL